MPPRCLFFCPRWGRGEGGGCTATPPSPPSPLFIGVQNTVVAPLPAPFAASQKKWGERPCHLPLFRRFLSIGVQERDCCPVAPPFVCAAEGGRCVASSFLPAVHCLFGRKDAIAALAHSSAHTGGRGEGVSFVPSCALLPFYLGQRRDCRPAACSFVRAGKEGASALFLPSRLPFPVYWEQRRACRPTAHPFVRTGEGRAAVLRPFRLLIPLPIEAKRCDYRPAVYSFVRAGEGVRRTAPLSACLPAHWGKKVRLAPCCPLLCPRRGRGSAVLIPFHLFPCPLGRKSAIVALLSTPLAAPGKRKQPCCPCHLAAAPAIGAQNTVVVPSSVPLSAPGKRRAGVSSAPFRLSFPVYWRQRRDCRPPLAPLSALWEGGGCVTALPARHPLPNGMQNRACPVFATPPSFAGQATAPPPSPSF